MTVALVPAMVGLKGNETGALVTSATTVLTNGQLVFTAVGDVQILDLYSECITANGAGATTVQYSITPASGTTTPISGVSASLANAAAGTTFTLVGDALATAPTVAASGVDLSQTSRGIRFPTGTMTLVVAIGPSTGTWRHYLRYDAFENGAYVY